MQTMTLKAEPRTIRGRKTFALRQKAQVPGVIYGSDIQPMMVTVSAPDFSRTLKGAGESSIVDLVVDGGEPLKVLIGDVQRDPIRDEIIHVDFRQVNMNKPVEAKIKLELIGEAPAVKALGGTLVQALEELEVKCLPGLLVPSIAVNISKLATFEDHIAVQEIIVPEGMQILTAPTMTIALVEAPRTEAELAALDQAVELDVTKIEVEKKGKEEEAAEGAAGEAAAPAPEANKKAEAKKNE